VTPSRPEARRLTAAETPAAARALARALHDDPGWIYTFPDERVRPGKMEAMIATVLRGIYLHHDECWTIDDGADRVAGAALWDPPGEHELPIGRALRIAPRLAWLMGRRLRAGVEVFRQMERRHPIEPHWYLALLGIDPAFQGRGLGPRLIAPILDLCDQDRLLCWLESANPRNHAFYRRAGFEVADVHRFNDDFSLTFFARRPR
jgi:GNAT superfamily N-acetyltransferase